MTHPTPTAPKRRGGPTFIPDVLTQAGLSRVVLHRWCKAGHLRAKLGENRRRTWPVREVRVALLMKRLSEAGFPLVLAATVARRFVATGAAEQVLAPGLTLVIDEPAEHRHAREW